MSLLSTHFLLAYFSNVVLGEFKYNAVAFFACAAIALSAINKIKISKKYFSGRCRKYEVLTKSKDLDFGIKYSKTKDLFTPPPPPPPPGLLTLAQYCQKNNQYPVFRTVKHFFWKNLTL